MKTVHFLSELQLAVAPPDLAHAASRPALALPGRVLVEYDYQPHRGALVRLDDRSIEAEVQEALTVTGVLAGQALHFTAPGVYITLAEGLDLAPFLAPGAAVTLELDLLSQARSLDPRCFA